MTKEQLIQRLTEIREQIKECEDAAFDLDLGGDVEALLSKARVAVATARREARAS